MPRQDKLSVDPAKWDRTSVESVVHDKTWQYTPSNCLSRQRTKPDTCETEYPTLPVHITIAVVTVRSPIEFTQLIKMPPSMPYEKQVKRLAGAIASLGSVEREDIRPTDEDSLVRDSSAAADVKLTSLPQTTICNFIAAMIKQRPEFDWYGVAKRTLEQCPGSSSWRDLILRRIRKDAKRQCCFLHVFVAHH